MECLKQVVLGILLSVFCSVLVMAQENNLVAQDESFDPLKLNEPPMSIYSGALIYEIFTGLGEGAKRTDTLELLVVDGYKVQLFSTEDFYLADSLYRMCIKVFGEGKVEKIFNSPYYKVRVGNCLTRDEAEELLRMAIEAGFEDSWIIRTKVKIKEHSGIY